MSLTAQSMKNTRVRTSGGSLTAQSMAGNSNYNKPELLPDDTIEVGAAPVEGINISAPPIENKPEDKLPYMATDKTAEGEISYSTENMQEGSFLENLWGASGFRTWARKTWSKIFDPELVGEGLDVRELEEAKELSPEISKNLEDRLAWSKWIEPLTGISSEEVAEPLAATQAETSAGDAVASGFGIFKRTVGQTIWGILGMFQAAEKGSRVISGVSQSLDDLLEEKGQEENRTGNSTLDTALDIVSLPIKLARVRGAMLMGKISQEELETTLVRGVASSSAIYALQYDKTLREDYIRRYEAGEDPNILAMEAAAKHPWVEIGGSIIFDPTTYLGLGLAKPVAEGAEGARYLRFMGKEIKWFGKRWKTVLEIPEFSDIVKLNVGSRKIASRADDLTKIADEFEPVLGALKKAGTENEARKAIQEVMTSVAKKIDSKKFTYGLTVMSSTGKSNILVKETTQVLKSIMATPGTPGEKMELIRAMVNMTRGKNPELALSVIARSKIPSVFFSERGLQAAEVLGRISDSGIINKILDKGGDAEKMMDELLQAVRVIADDTYASIDEMYLASKNAPELVKRFSPEKVARLAEDYKNVPAWAKRGRSVARQYEKIWNIQRGYMGKVFLAWKPAQPIRNMFGQLAQLSTKVGLVEALRISGEAVKESYAGTKAFNKIVETKSDEIKKILGVVPGRFTAGIGIANELQDKASGFMKISQHIEELTSANLYLDVTKKVLSSALQGAVPKLSDFTKIGLDKTEAALAMRAIEETYGRADEAMKAFKEFTKNAEVEKWRQIKPNGKLKEFLEKMDVVDEFSEIQKTSQTSTEFAERIKKFMGDFTALAEDTLKKEHMGGIDLDAEPQVKQVLADMAEQRFGGTEYRYFENMIQSWRNARASTEKILDSMNAVINRAAASMGVPSVGTELVDNIGKVRQKWATVYPTVDRIRQTTVDVVKALRKEDADVIKIWNEAKVMGDTERAVYSLAEMFPNVNPAQLTRQEIISLAWKGYFYRSGEMLGGGNLEFASRALKIVQDAAKKVGLDINKADNFDVPLQKLFDQNAADIALAKQWDKLHMQERLWGGGDFNLVKYAESFGFSTATKAGVKTDKSLLGMIEKNTGKTFEKLEDVPEEVAIDAFEKWRKLRKEPLPPHISTTIPTKSRIAVESQYDFFADVQKHADNVIGHWGEAEPISKFDSKKLKAVEEIFKKTDDMMSIPRAKALAIAEETRDFVLHDYNKTGLDMLLAYYSPFIYWQTQTISKGMEIILENPELASRYMKYKQFNENQHAGMPDFWKQSIMINGIPWMQGNPLMLNLEATVNPYYNILGTDFNDPNKRVDWFTRMVDDTNQLGMGSMPLLNWGIALALYEQGRKEAADRWLGRFIPQTRSLKALQALVNWKIPGSKHGELDPFVLAMGGQDPYERRQTGRAGAEMVMEGTLAAEEGIDAAFAQKGDTWEAMTERALDDRSVYQLMAEFMGVGFKARTAGDMKVDEFYSEYRNLLALRESMSPETYRVEWDKLRAKYDFADTVLLSARSGEARDSSYAYNVLGRIPPGDMSTLLKMSGIQRDQINSFYENKGDMSSWSQADKDSFIGAIGRLASILTLPNEATRADWTNAKILYDQMQKRIKSEFGADIYDKIDAYYKEKDRGVVYGQEYLEKYPEVKAAFQRQDEYVLGTPEINAYYGGLETIERNARRRADSEIAQKYGNDIFDLERQYAKIIDAKDKKAFMREHPSLKKYYDSKEKSQWQEWVNREVGRLGKLLPEPTMPEFRDVNTPTEIQNLLKENILKDQRGVSAQELLQQMTPELQQMVQLYAQGQELPYSALQQLEYLGGAYGLSGNEVLQVILAGQ